MIRNLLTLIFLSATFFASAQRQINVVQLEASTGSTTPTTHQQVAHVYSGNYNPDTSYLDVYEVSSVSTYTFRLNPPPGMFITSDSEYIGEPGFLYNLQELYSRIGPAGLFLNPITRINVEPSDVLSVDPIRLFRISTKWRPFSGSVTEAGRTTRWVYRIPSCNLTYVVGNWGSGWSISETLNGDTKFLIAADQSHEGSIATSSRYAHDLGGSRWLRVEDSIEAVDDRVALVCGGCTNTVAESEVINSLIEAAEPNYEDQRNGTWIDRDVNERGFAAATWNSIEIDEVNRVFVLEIGAGGDGLTGTRISYRCLEMLLLDLPN